MLRALSQVAQSAAGHGYSPSLLLLLCSVVWGRGEQGGWEIKFSSCFLKSAFMFRISEEDIQVEWESPTPADITTPRVVAAPHQSPVASSVWEEWEQKCGRQGTSGGQWSRSAGGLGGSEDSQHSTGPCLQERAGALRPHSLNPRQHTRLGLDTHCLGLSLIHILKPHTSLLQKQRTPDLW